MLIPTKSFQEWSPVSEWNILIIACRFFYKFHLLGILITNGQGLPSSSPWILSFYLGKQEWTGKCFVITSSSFPFPGTMILPVPSYKDALPKQAHRGAESRRQPDCKLCTSFTSPLYFLIFSTTCAMSSGLTVKRDIFSLPCHDSVVALGNWK